MKGVEAKVYTHIFSIILSSHASKWNGTLLNLKAQNCDTLKKEFYSPYNYSLEFPMTQRNLKVTKQKETEGFTEFLSRWRGKASQVVNRPLEKDQARMFIKNLTPNYKDHLQFQAINTYEELYDPGIRIEDALTKKNKSHPKLM